MTKTTKTNGKNGTNATTATTPPVASIDAATDREGWAMAGVVLGGLGVLAATLAYWLVLPGVAFGIAAIVLGIRARRRASREVGSVAIALGITALVLVPAVLVTVDGAEDWGRECALRPSNPDC